MSRLGDRAAVGAALSVGIVVAWATRGDRAGLALGLAAAAAAVAYVAAVFVLLAARSYRGHRPRRLVEAARLRRRRP